MSLGLRGVWHPVGAALLGGDLRYFQVPFDLGRNQAEHMSE